MMQHDIEIEKFWPTNIFIKKNYILSKNLMKMVHNNRHQYIERNSRLNATNTLKMSCLQLPKSNNNNFKY